MKKTLALILVLVMSLSLVACGGKKDDSSASSGSSSSSSSSSSSTSTSDKAEGPLYTITGGTESTEDNLLCITLTKFKEIVEEKTDGAIAVRVFPNSELGDELSMLEQTRSGDLDVVVVGGANFASLVPEFQVLSVPYLWGSFEDFSEGMSEDSEVWKIMTETTLEKNAGVYLAAPTTIGCRWVANTKGEIRTPEDMKKLGLVMRIQANPVEATTWSTFGTQTTNMPMPDVFTAMQQGVVDCVENSPDIMYNYKIQEVAKYFSATEHNWYFAAVAASDTLMDRIPEEYRETVQAAFREASDYVFSITLDAQAKSIKGIEDSGATVVYDVDKAAFSSMISDLYDEVAAANGAEDLLAACRAIG